MKRFAVKYIYYDGHEKHLGIAIVFADVIEECEKKVSDKINKTYENGFLIKLSNDIREVTEDVFIVK